MFSKHASWALAFSLLPETRYVLTHRCRRGQSAQRWIAQMITSLLDPAEEKARTKAEANASALKEERIRLIRQRVVAEFGACADEGPSSKPPAVRSNSSNRRRPSYVISQNGTVSRSEEPEPNGDASNQTPAQIAARPKTHGTIDAVKQRVRR